MKKTASQIADTVLTKLALSIANLEKFKNVAPEGSRVSQILQNFAENSPGSPKALENLRKMPWGSRAFSPPPTFNPAALFKSSSWLESVNQKLESMGVPDPRKNPEVAMMLAASHRPYTPIQPFPPRPMTLPNLGKPPDPPTAGAGMRVLA